MPIITQPVYTKSGLIRYRSTIQQPKLNTSNKTLLNLCRLIQNHPLEFSLQFSGIYAHYTNVVSRELQDFELNFLHTLLQYKECFIDSKHHILAQKVHHTWIQQTLDYQWKITGDTRLFNGNYLEHAEAFVTIPRHLKPSISLKVDAWFCRSLPYFFGPMGYCGLPGMILAVEFDKISLQAVEIQIDSEFTHRVQWIF